MNGYTDRAGIDNRANCALLAIRAIAEDVTLPAAARLLMIAERIETEPILTDGSPAARALRESRR